MYILHLTLVGSTVYIIITSTFTVPIIKRCHTNITKITPLDSKIIILVDVSLWGAYLYVRSVLYFFVLLRNLAMQEWFLFLFFTYMA